MARPLDGAYLDIVVVDDLGEEEEEETIIGQTFGDIEVERDSEIAEWIEHNNDVLQKRELATEVTLTFEMLLTDDRENLSRAELINEEGEVQKNIQHDAVRLVFYESPHAEEPDSIYEMEEVIFMFGTMELETDEIGSVEVEGWVNGPQHFLSPGDLEGGE